MLALTTGAELLAEGMLTSAFLARIGAESLPAALAARAVAEAVLSIGYERLTARTGPRRALFGVMIASVVLLAVMAASLGLEVGVWAGYVLAGVIARIKVIHFGVLALSELREAGRTLPLVFAAGRAGAVLAGPIVSFAGPVLGPAPVVAGSALLYLASAALLRPRGPDPSASEEERSVYSESEGPLSRRSSRPPAPDAERRSSRSLLWAIILGAVALALGRLALVTQSGAILEQRFAEAELNRVLGLYFVGANLVAILLQVTLVSRTLGGAGLPLLNSGWSLLYLGAQCLLVLGPPSVAVALGARMVESELRNAIRTPVANLLYEAIPPAERARARTLVIGVTVPLASLAGGVVLGALKARPLPLAVLGMGAAIALVLTSWAQNRGWRASRHFTPAPAQR